MISKLVLNTDIKAKIKRKYIEFHLIRIFEGNFLNQESPCVVE